MDTKLSGRTVLITGGTRGIGRATAELFAAEGANVAIMARNATQVEEAVTAVKATGVKAFGRAVDQADGEATKQFILDVAEEFGGIDAYISNATSAAESNSAEAWQNAIAVDLMGAVNASKAVWPFLEAAAARHGDSSFLAISSIAAKHVDAPDAYASIKAGLITFTKGLARIGGAKGVRANNISPGMVYVDDGFFGKLKREAPDEYEQMLAVNPGGRMGRPDEVAAAAVFLSSPLASFISGANLVVDGAVTMTVNF